MDTPRLLKNRYRLDRVIGRGGMGVVWLATDEVLDRPVAVKEVAFPPGLPDEEQDKLRRRTLREARTNARLNHPNVVGVYDIVDQEDRPWIVMEFVPSRSLAETVRADGPLSPERTAAIGLQLLRGLRAAHAAGVLHRDVKPSNVLLAEDGRVVLGDFGIATAKGGSTVTSSGVLIGSPSYMAPERARGRDVGPESDLWSLGATLYTAVEGRPPFDRDSAVATLAALVMDDPDTPERAGPLWPLISSLLRRDPSERPPPEAVAASLREIAGHSREAWPPARTTGRPPVPRPRPPLDEAPSLPSPPPADPSPKGNGHRPSGPAGAGTGDPEAAGPRTSSGAAGQDEPAGDGSDESGPTGTEAGSASGAAGHAPDADTGSGGSGVEAEDPSEADGEGPDAADGGSGDAGPEESDTSWRTTRARAGGAAGRGGTASRPVADQAGDREGRTTPPGGTAPSSAGTGTTRTTAFGGSSGRGRRRTVILTGGAAIVVIVLLAWVVAGLTGGHHPRHQTARHAPTAPGRAASRPTTTPTPSAATPSTSPPASPTTGVLPAGYHWHHDSTGFSIAVPDGWSVTHHGHYLYVEDSKSSRILIVDQTDTPKSDPLADWRRQEAARRDGYSGYHRIRLEAVDYPQARKAADWEFTYNGSGGRDHVLNRNILVNGKHAYALYWSTPADRWTSSRSIFDAFASSFKPATD